MSSQIINCVDSDNDNDNDNDNASSTYLRSCKNS